MLRKAYRLRRSADIQYVQRHGQRWHHPLLILLVSPNDLEVSRFAFSASRRVGNAVQRNETKRLLREAVHYHLSGIKPGQDCLFIVRSGLVGKPFAQVQTIVTELLQRATLLVGPTLELGL